MQGSRFRGQDLKELIDLYLWGARMSDLCMLYGVHKQTIQAALRRSKIQMRAPYRSLLVEPKPHRENTMIKSSRPTIPAGVRLVDGDQAPDQLLRSSARAQQDRRIEERRRDVSTRSCREAAS